MSKYQRDARAALAFTKGFPPEIAGALSQMIDLMALHTDDGGIPADPKTYLVGMLALSSERKWVQTIEPALLGAKRLRKVKRDGIMVYRFPDEFMPGGERALFGKLMTATEIRAKWDAMGEWLRSQPTGTKRSREIMSSPEFQKAVQDMMKEKRPPPPTNTEMPGIGRDIDPIEEPQPEQPVNLPDLEAGEGGEPTKPSIPDIIAEIGEKMQAGLDEVAPPAMPFPPVTPEMQAAQDDPLEQDPIPPLPTTPAYSAYAILKRAGVDVDNHHRGELFWHRHDHNDTLARWLEVLDVNEIVKRIDLGRVNGQMPDTPNSLLAFESLVLGESA